MVKLPASLQATPRYSHTCSSRLSSRAPHTPGTQPIAARSLGVRNRLSPWRPGRGLITLVRMKDGITISAYSNSPRILGVERIDYGHVAIFKTSVGSMDNCVYLLVDSQRPDNSLLIDAADDADHLMSLVKHVGAEVRTIVTTHCHSDHIQALPKLLGAFSARHISSALDAEKIPVPTDRRLTGGETITFGNGIELSTFVLRGHTAGGLCIDLSRECAGALSDDSVSHHLFVGDSIFPGGVGKTYSPQDFRQLVDDVEERVFRAYPADALIHPGHGKDTSVEAESPKIDDWRERGW